MVMKPIARMLDSGEQALVVEFGDSIDPAINARVHQLARQLNGFTLPGMLEVIPTYRSLMVRFDPLVLRRESLKQKITEMCASYGGSGLSGESKVTLIPVSYGGDFGPDLEFVARHNGLSPQEVIALHTSTPYLVYMLGFTPGFPYLGGMSQRLATPRLESPRQRIPAGSVGIAGAQTGIYPIQSPGGWRLIGRTPITLFSPRSPQPFLFSAGEYLQFTAVSADEYAFISTEVAVGRFNPQVRYMQSGGSHVHGS